TITSATIGATWRRSRLPCRVCDIDHDTSRLVASYRHCLATFTLHRGKAFRSLSCGHQTDC
ncbi:hypothetical protein, partial [Burkholderia contaminans]|uniref:hypothetical protein n=1 Tax=Burkholderia contaminans TaxID=488447 RepID=UPI0031115B31